MLTPEYLAKCTSTLLGMYDVIDEIVIADIARQLARAGTITEDIRWQVDIAQDTGALLAEIQAQLAVLTPYTVKEMQRIFVEAGYLSMQNDAEHIGKRAENMSPAMKQLMNAQVMKTLGDVQNLTRTLGTTATDLYIRAATNAEMLTESGAFSYTDAIRRAIIQTAEDGNFVTYPSGRRDHIDVAIRRATLTGVQQTTGQITEEYSKENNVEYYEVSAHAGARPSHAEWQGQVYKINGSDGQYRNFYEATGYGSGEGLCGYNCRHSFYPYVPGISKRAYTQRDIDDYTKKKYEYQGTKYDEYEISQMMRAHERDIRAKKRTVVAYEAALEETKNPELIKGIKDDISYAKSNLKDSNKRYEEFCKKTAHKPDRTRTQVYAIKTASGQVRGYRLKKPKQTI